MAGQAEAMVMGGSRRETLALKREIGGRLDFTPFAGLTGYVPHGGQREIHESRARFRVAVAGRRSGKSIAAAHEAAFNALLPDARVWILAPYKELSGRVWKVAREILVERLRLRPESDRVSEMYVRFPWGAELVGKTAENPDSLLGEGLDFVVVDEAPRVREGLFSRFVLPSLADKRGRALIIGTPRGRGWVWELARGSRKDPAWDVFSFPSSANPYLDAEELLLHRRLLSLDDYRREYLAEWVAEGSLVYPMFDPALHVEDVEFDERLPLYLGVDFGFTNPGCVLFAQVTAGEHLRVLDEIYRRGMTATEWASAVQAKLESIRRVGEKPLMRPGDSYLTDRVILRGMGGGVNAIRNHYAGGSIAVGEGARGSLQLAFCDPSGAGERAIFERHGIPTAGVRAGVDEGIARVRALLVPGDESVPPRITISPRCVNLVREFSNYSYAEDGRERGHIWGGSASQFESRVIKADDHALDALRYLVVGLGV